ncbi:MAG: hypothetical protein P1P86_10315 [Bacteroidales bacterium]|nr:hypothetical protein [Bacteroidales bacterium]
MKTNYTLAGGALPGETGTREGSRLFKARKRKAMDRGQAFSTNMAHA